jgi:penicillin-binding protein 1A
MLEGPVQQGTATEAAIPGVIVSGKTGTTSNYGDAWFVGWTPQMTVAVWVGFPSKLIPMSTLYNGGPVEGGTYPAIIWRTFMEQALQILAQEAAASQSGQTTTTTTPITGVATVPASTGATSTTPAATTPTTTPAAGANTTATPHTTTPAPSGNPGSGTTGGNTGAGTGGNTGAGTGGSTGGGTGGTTAGPTGGTGLGSGTGGN